MVLVVKSLGKKAIVCGVSLDTPRKNLRGVDNMLYVVTFGLWVYGLYVILVGGFLDLLIFGF